MTHQDSISLLIQNEKDICELVKELSRQISDIRKEMNKANEERNAFYLQHKMDMASVNKRLDNVDRKFTEIESRLNKRK